MAVETKNGARGIAIKEGCVCGAEDGDERKECDYIRIQCSNETNTDACGALNVYTL